MKAKSVLLTVPLAVSALTFLTLPANAVCWSWKPCADLQGYGYGAPTESQAVLRPLPADGSAPPGSTAAPGDAPGATAAPGPAGAPEKLKPAKKPAATATAAPQAQPAPAKPKPAPVPAQAKAAPPSQHLLRQRQHHLGRQRLFSKLCLSLHLSLNPWRRQRQHQHRLRNRRRLRPR